MICAVRRLDESAVMTLTVGREEYSWFNALTDTAPQLMSATYRFRPSTGAVNVVEGTLKQPTSITLSPDGKTMYISDTGADTGIIDPRFPSIHSATFNATGKRTVYKYDIVGRGVALVNERRFTQPGAGRWAG